MTERDAQLRQALATQVAEILDAALPIEPAGGTSAAWDAVLRRLGVTPLPEDARFAAAQREQQARGAPIEEVSSCLERVVAAARGAQAGLLPAQAMELEALLARVPEQIASQYRQAACARPRGMFGYALADARQHRYERWHKTSSYVLRCPSCGGPQLEAGSFTCEYCGAPLAGSG
ncbi:MAG TPA: hypothetical protein VKN99_16825 [Polyangia bacterium]|nr:hypothetical protein [Polyangia bacterium]